MSKIIKVILKIVLLFGCIYHTFNLSDLYFSYETSTNIRYEFQSETSLPAISICHDKMSQIKRAMLDKFDMKYDGNLTHYMGNITIRDQFRMMEELPRRLEYCIVKINVPGYNQEALDCSSLVNFTNYMDVNHFCFTIFPQLNKEPDNWYKVYEPDNRIESNFLVYINLIKHQDSYMNFMSVQFHSRNQLIHDWIRRGSILLDINDSKIIHLKYSKTIVDYKTKRFCSLSNTSREECISKCTVDDFVTKFGKYPANYLTNNRDIDLRFMTREEQLNLSHVNDCQKSCQWFVDCYKEYFIPELNVVTLPGQLDNVVQLQVEFPSVPPTVYEISQKMHFEEYLCLLSSILSLWFGFSIITFTDFCWMFVVKLSGYFQFNNQFNVQIFTKPKIRVTVHPNSLANSKNH